ncbi:hypothetical protein [Stenomitos frigidus]|uniref:Uncharacterized protein n=1 Tax=Stenomitos frigidus ULC18 TaxID=2107698 RepID=A0A2T1DZ29_9CYAN|nr:hypothetical protein [Stenomitos frigidus]PSB25763.1 hypothetical protein C7B82_22170 [Stenomitos frigidus ULC18]
MESFGTTRILRTAGLIALSLLAASVLLKPGSSLAQALPASPNRAQPIDPNDPSVLKPTDQDAGLLSQQGGKRLLDEADKAVTAQNYPTAIKKLQEARQVFNQLSNFYQDLAGSFSGIDNRIADTQRRKALEAAEMRDQATYQLALVHRAQSQPELAVPLLVQIIRSQQPTRSLGQKAYQQLLELGFVDAPYPRPRADQPSAAPR